MAKLTSDISGYQWTLPEKLEVLRDELRVRLDFYQDNTILYVLEKGIITTRRVSARELSLAILSEVQLNSGLLPKSTLWWKQDKTGVQIALWRPPKVWPVALQENPFQPARRFRLPMPGLIFICSAGQAPQVFAAKKRPQSLGDFIYHAPLFNVYQDGRTCAGTVKYPQDMEKIPEAFFASFFSEAANFTGRSKKYPKELLKLWEEIDGKTRYPLDDLVQFGKVEDIMNDK